MRAPALSEHAPRAQTAAMASAKRPLPEKSCRVCGRTMVWRKRWARSWDTITTCSDACRSKRAAPTDLAQALERTILELARARAPASICPSEVARAIAPEGWRDLMQTTRDAARRLVQRGVVDITQGGRPVDPSTARGPIRIRAREVPD